MNYIRKKFADAANKVVSWFSTDDNVLCQNGKYLNENLDAIDNKFKEVSKQFEDISNPFNINTFIVTPSVAQKGSTVSVSVKWTYSREVTSQTLNDTSLELNIRDKTFANVKTDTTYTLTAISTNNTKTKSGSIKFYNGIYYGKSSSTTYDSALINSLTKTLSNSKARTITVNAGAGEYIYYCLPTRLGVPGFNVGGFDGGFNKIATINFTNSDSYAEDYDVYKSTNSGLGNTTITIK